MTAQLAALAPVQPGSVLAKLESVLRPEFCGEMIRIEPDDPVFARGRCAVAGCERGGWSRALCGAHYQRWLYRGRPDLEVFTADPGRPIRLKPGSERVDTFDLRSLGGQLRLEVAYSIQCRHDDRTVRLIPDMVRRFVSLLATSGCGSLLDRPVEEWVDAASAAGMAGSNSRVIGQLRYAYRRLSDLVEGIDADSEFRRDLWRAAAWGVPATQQPQRIRFDPISQPWLRQAAKRYARFRIGSGKAFGTVDIDVRALRWLSRFLTEHHPGIADESGLSRSVVEAYIPWLGSQAIGANPLNTYLVALRGFLEACRRHGWLPLLDSRTAVYLDELPSRPRPLPRFIPQFVMSQLEDPTHLELLGDDTTRNLIVVIMETGLRANDACRLVFNPIIDDSVGWPCLRFVNTKMRSEQLIPLSERAAHAVRAQQQQLTQRWAEPPPVLFPSPHTNPDGVRPFSYATLRSRFAAWQDRIGLHDETGQPIRVTLHQFRHTLGTRMINQGVPQHVVQKMLGHASPQMTARYATIHDATVRAAFDDYQRRRVDITGRRLDFDPDTPAAEAEWIKHNLARVAASLPNGYCGRPPQQDCPHPNACLTCPDFQTTPQFLSIHRRQHDDTLALLAAAEKAGNVRLADNHRQVATNLERIITALDALDNKEPTDAS